MRDSVAISGVLNLDAGGNLSHPANRREGVRGGLSTYVIIQSSRCNYAFTFIKHEPPRDWTGLNGRRNSMGQTIGEELKSRELLLAHLLSACLRQEHWNLVVLFAF
ncbi:hypothetical protein CDAR_458011 [Caerostris darwini]|uniref:Uncharacterized protein n=1 Tax=Caerostris darwini TaxID=1538125 RepID=A0AAV4TR37_9ARAC|nr:hypothetical protein CDAR_458011 [Caerostris darwini]